jgi:hypothetical protein
MPRISLPTRNKRDVFPIPALNPGRCLFLPSACRIIEAISFVTTDPALFGEMTLAATFEEVSGGTEVTLLEPYRVNGASIGRADRLILDRPRRKENSAWKTGTDRCC